jgi:YaiO family outer membrane protein
VSGQPWLWAALLLGIIAPPVAALETEAGGAYEHLTGGKPDWKSVYLEAAHSFAPRQALYGMLRQTERFDLRDREVSAGYAHPFGSQWTGVIEASHSPEHNVLPEKSLFGQVYWSARGGWVLNGGARFNQYSSTDTRILTAGVERYFSSYRAAYTLYNGKPEDTGSASSHRLAFDHYYDGERSRIGVAVAWGREVENVGPPSGIVSSDVRALALVGRHWLTPDWAVAWEVGTHEQGDLYRRTGGRLGLRYHF